jgi:hypothetical protein
VDVIADYEYLFLVGRLDKEPIEVRIYISRFVIIAKLNMSIPRGSRCYFPVFVKGANLSVGDLHFSQGDVSPASFASCTLGVTYTDFACW